MAYYFHGGPCDEAEYHRRIEYRRRRADWERKVRLRLDLVRAGVPIHEDRGFRPAEWQEQAMHIGRSNPAAALLFQAERLDTGEEPFASQAKLVRSLVADERLDEARGALMALEAGLNAREAVA